MNVIRTKRTLVASALVGAALSTACFFHQRGLWNNRRQQLLRDAAERSEFESKAQAAEKTLELVTRKVAEAEEALSLLPRSNGSSQQIVGKIKIHDKDGVLALMEGMLDDPEFQVIYLTAERSCIPDRYRPLLRQLNLPAADQERLHELILKRNEEWMDIDDAVRAQLDTKDNASASDLRDRAAASFETEVVSLFGEPAYRALSEYERALPAWEMVNTFAGAVALQGQPLSEAQASQLVSVLANSSPTYRSGGNVDLNTVEWSEVGEGTARVLTPPQEVSFRNAAPIYRVEPPSVTSPPSRLRPPDTPSSASGG